MSCHNLRPIELEGNYQIMVRLKATQRRPKIVGHSLLSVHLVCCVVFVCVDVCFVLTLSMYGTARMSLFHLIVTKALSLDGGFIQCLKNIILFMYDAVFLSQNGTIMECASLYGFV